MATQAHPPKVVFVMLALLGLVCAAVVGHGVATANPVPWAHMVGFAFVTALVVYTTLELEYPRRGIIRLDRHDQVLVDLLRTMNPGVVTGR
jgi:hypothetical protein